MNTVRILISLAVNLNWKLLQYNIKNVFLHGDLDKEIYMRIPLEYEQTKNRTKVLPTGVLKGNVINSRYYTPIIKLNDCTYILFKFSLCPIAR